MRVYEDIHVSIEFKNGLKIREACQSFQKNAYSLMLQDCFEKSVFDLSEIKSVTIEPFGGTEQ